MKARQKTGTEVREVEVEYTTDGDCYLRPAADGGHPWVFHHPPGGLTVRTPRVRIVEPAAA